MWPMTNRIGRNDLCPCGSGKKYKRCCLTKDTEETKTEFKTTYRFEVGSYGDARNFMPSISCLKLTRPNEWEYHFALVKPESIHTEEAHATSEAENDMSDAFKIKDAEGSDAALAMELKRKGYFRVDNLNVVNSSTFHA